MLRGLLSKLLAQVKYYWYESRRRGLSQSGWVEVERLGFRWRLCMDRYLDRQIATGSVWELNSVKLVKHFIKPGMCVLDVGANFGYFTLLFARLTNPTGIVIAFEPTQEYASRLEWHLRENHIKNVYLECLGLSDKNEELEISIGECSATLHWCSNTSPRLREKIKLMRLDDWWDSVDGHEPNLLIGGERTLHRHRPYILIEFSQEALFAAGHSAWDLADQLVSMGYTLCSEEDGEPFESRQMLLKKVANFAYSANVLARPH
jgi:FkbM family methyltransferase